MTTGSEGETHSCIADAPREAAIEQLHARTAIYTNEPIVAQLLDQLHWPMGDRSLVDSSAGDGAFLGLALKRLLKQQPHLADDEIVARIQGWEIHPVAASHARQRLCDILVGEGRSATRSTVLASRLVHNKDFLLDGPEPGQKYSVCVGNPPYLRFANVPDPLHFEYRQVLPAYAHSDLLHAFLARAADVLEVDGELGWITADRWLFNAAAAALRQEVGKRFSIADVRRLDPSSTFYRPKYRRAGSPPRVHPVSIILKQKAAGSTPLSRDPIYPGEMAYIPPSNSGTLGDIAHVRLCPWLGTAGVFLVDAEVATRLPADHLVPAVDTDDIKDGRLTGHTRFAIATERTQKPPPAILAHLAREMPRMCARGMRTGTPWIPPERFSREDLKQPSLLVPRISRTLRSVRVPAGVLPVNHNLSIVRSGAASLEEIEALLCSPESTRWMEHHAARLENGYRSVTTRLLRTLPVWT